jgi:hypothetical protein
MVRSVIWVCVHALLCGTPHSVAVDLSALDRQSYGELDAVALERAMVVRLVQEGFAVVAPSADPQIRIRVTRKGRTVQLAAGQLTAQVEVELRRLREFHLEAAQKAAELARAASTALPPEPDLVTPPPPAVAAVAPAPPPEPKWNVLAAGGILLRAPGLDARAVLAARYALSKNVGAHLELGLSPIVSPALAVFDGALSIGAGLQLISAQVFRLEAGLSLGILLHNYSVPLAAAEDRFGTRADFLARPFLRAVLNPVSGLLIWLQAGAGLSSRAREHRVITETVYARGALWVDVLAGLGWEL